MKSFLKCFDSLLCLTDLIDSCHPSENSIIDNWSRGNNVYLRALSFYCKHQLLYKETNLNCKRSWRELRFVLAATLLSGREDISSGSGCGVDELVVRVGPSIPQLVLKNLVYTFNFFFLNLTVFKIPYFITPRCYVPASFCTHLSHLFCL